MYFNKDFFILWYELSISYESICAVISAWSFDERQFETIPVHPYLEPK